MLDFFKKMSLRSKVIIVVGIILSLIVRVLFFNYESQDYNIFLVNWVDFIKNNGGFNALKYTFSDYNLPYLSFLSLISYFSIKPLYLIKIFSLIFDYLIAILGCKYVMKFKKDYKEKDIVLVFMFLIFSPTIFLNSSCWGQCDSIYTFFSLLSIYYLCDEKIIKAFIFFGIALSFKLQAIFILPVFIIMYFCKNRIKIWHFFIVPIVNAIMCLPGILAGASFFYTYETYFFQVGEYKTSAMNVLNIYNYFPSGHLTNVLGICFTGLLFFSLLVFAYFKRKNITSSSILILTLLSITMCYFFLPCMHERYLYMGDVLSIVLLFVLNINFLIPLFINLTSLITYYIMYKLTYHVSTYMYGPIIMAVGIVLVFLKFISTVSDNGEKNSRECMNNE